MIIISGCSGVSRKEANAFKNLYSSGQFSGARQLILDKRYYPKANSRLLHFLELGTLHHIEGNYHQSLLYFDAAKELSDKLFTVSIKKKVASFLASDNSDNYYGDIFERSHIRFYQALSHLMLAQQGYYEEHPKDLFAFTKKKKEEGDNKEITISKRKILSLKEKRFHLQAARAAIVDWDTYLSTQKKELLGIDQYKVDMAQRVFGAHVHKLMATRSDKRISRSLLKEVQDVLFKNYNVYPSFNSKSDAFRRDYKKLPKLKKKKVEQEYILQTNHAKSLLSFVDKQIAQLKKKTKKNKTSVTVVLRDGQVVRKRAEKTNFPIGFNTLTYSTVRKADFVSFVRKVLALSALGAPTISFELPVLAPLVPVHAFDIIVKTSEDKVVVQKPMALINPLNDFAHESLKKSLPAIKKKVGARLVTKHLSALMASYLTYRSTVKKQGEFFALSIATAAYYVANKSIKASEKADLRSWTTLPANIRMSDFTLSPGSYKVSILDKVTGQERFVGPLSIQEGAKTFTYSKRIL